MKRLFLFLALAGVFGISNAQNLPFGDTLRITSPGGGPIDGGIGNLPPKHSPANLHLPIVIHQGDVLKFVGTGQATLYYRIENDYDEPISTGVLLLSSGQEVSVDISDLPSGIYYLILAIAGREYEGEFFVE